jgi:hypothetical protein
VFSSGFKHVGDLVCLESENVGIRGYARPGGNMWTFFRVSAPDEIQLEVASIFDGGVVLTRSEEANPENAKELIATHESRLAEMGESLGLPQPTVLTMKGFAEACEVVRSQAPN